MKTHDAAVDADLLCALQALADENRLRILEALHGGEHCVCELQSALALGQSLLSHHLRVLREAGLVRDRREGRWVHYALAPEGLRRVEDAVGGLRAAAETPPMPSGDGGVHPLKTSDPATCATASRP
ncbi:MAG TPA: metalloregulator ArsR/SmtB family transcription factor [Longimicrobiales bacterium]|nr:metalloregulator ArsR/SmtB family transcription factor [Longimicrobiales bacterium]